MQNYDKQVLSCNRNLIWMTISLVLDIAEILTRQDWGNQLFLSSSKLYVFAHQSKLYAHQNYRS